MFSLGIIRCVVVPFDIGTINTDIQVIVICMGV